VSQAACRIPVSALSHPPVGRRRGGPTGTASGAPSSELHQPPIVGEGRYPAGPPSVAEHQICWPC